MSAAGGGGDFEDAYRPSPRPSFTEPTAIPRTAAVRHVWGDPTSGEVLDWIYVSSGLIHQLLFEIPAGGQFTHSDAHRTIFGADEVLYVVDGDIVFADPQSGQVLRAGAGEAICFGPDTWHHCFNWGPGPARVLELFAPPPAAGTSSAHARTRPLLNQVRYRDDAILGAGIHGPAVGAAPQRLTLVRAGDVAWRLEGDRAPILVGVISSTEQLTATLCETRATSWSGWRTHGGDAAGYVVSGTLALRVSGGSNRSWHELAPGDGFFVPRGAGYQVRGLTSENAVFLLGAAPTYGGE